MEKKKREDKERERERRSTGMIACGGWAVDVGAWIVVLLTTMGYSASVVGCCFGCRGLAFARKRADEQTSKSVSLEPTSSLASLSVQHCFLCSFRLLMW